MAKARDYKAEYARAKELARQKGFKSPYVQKKQVRTGIVKVARKGNSYHYYKPNKVNRKEPPFVLAGFDDPASYNQAQKDARKWSNEHSLQVRSRYNNVAKTNPEAFRHYYDGFVNKDISEKDKIEAILLWMDEDNGYIEEKEKAPYKRKE